MRKLPILVTSVLFSAMTASVWAADTSATLSAFRPDARAAAQVKGAIPSAEALPRFAGAFLCVGADKDAWTAEQWAFEFDRMQELGLRELILAHVMTVPKNAAGGEIRTFYPSQIPGVKPTKNDLVERMLTEADKRGLKMHLGLVLDEGWWTGQSAEFLDRLTSRSIAVADETYKLYRHHASLAGYYITNEMDNAAWHSDKAYALVTQNFLKPVSDYVKSLNADLIVSQAPFFNAASMPYLLTPQKYGEFWQKVFTDVPHLDWLIPQDGIGVYHATLEQVGPFFEEMGKVCRANGRAFWSDLETFDLKPQQGSGVADIRRVMQQLSLESPLVEGFVFWEYFSNLSPAVSLAGQDLYLQYRHYLFGGKPLVLNSDIAKSVTFTPAAMDNESEARQQARLTDGETGMVNRLQVRWAGSDEQTPITMTVELHSPFIAIADCRASFLHDPMNGDVNPQSVRVEVSDDNLDYKPFGELKPVVPPMSGMPNRVAVLWSKPVTTGTMSAKYVRFIVTPPVNSQTACHELQVLTENEVVNPEKKSAGKPANLAQGMPYLLSDKSSEQYPDDGKVLTDGKVIAAYRNNVGWIGMKKDFSVTVDLKKEAPIKRVDVGYFYSPGSGIFFPKGLDVSLSADGVTFGEPTPMELEQNGNDEISYYQCEEDGALARFVRVTVKPDLAGRNEWLMLGEISVWKHN